jgi:hypothetical protein
MMSHNDMKVPLPQAAPVAAASRFPKQKLPANFEPSNYTVLCGRGKDCFNFVGNRRFRVLVDMNLERYSRADAKSEKSRIVVEVVDSIRSSGGGFVKQEADGFWYDVGDAVAREKVGAHFRDCLHGKYKSSSKSKTARRRAVRKRSMTGSVCSEGTATDEYSSGDGDSCSGKQQQQQQLQEQAFPEPVSSAESPLGHMRKRPVRFSLIDRDAVALLMKDDFEFGDSEDVFAV